MSTRTPPSRPQPRRTPTRRTPTRRSLALDTLITLTCASAACTLTPSTASDAATPPDTTPTDSSTPPNTDPVGPPPDPRTDAAPQATPRATSGIHVATTGSDASGDGTAGAPYASIQHALDNAGPGSNVLVHAGTYPGPVRIRHSGLTLQSAPGEQAHIRCTVSIDENDPILCVEIDAETTGVRLLDLEVSGGFYSVFLGSQWDWDDTPTDNATASNVLIEGCRLHDSGRDVVKIPAGCDDITIRDCEIYNSGMGYPAGTSLDDKNAEGIDAVNADRVWIVDTHIHDTATTCAYVKGGSIDTVIERVRAERCGALGLVLGFDTSPEYFDRTVNPEYFENLGGVIRNSTVIDTGYAGIALYATRDASLLHNTVVRTATLGQAPIYLGVATQDYDPAAGRPANVGARIEGNVVDQTGVDGTTCVAIRYSDDDELGELSGLSGTAVLRNNLYWHPNGCTFDDPRPGQGLDAVDLAAWVVSSGDSGSIAGDPQLDATAHLQADSAAIDAIATPTEGVGFDIDGVARTGAWDIGADER